MCQALVDWAIAQGLSLFGATGWILLVLREYFVQRRADRVAKVLEEAVKGQVMASQALHSLNTTVAVLASKVEGLGRK